MNSYNESGQAGTKKEQEIQVTAEMIEAGVAALFTWSGEFEFERLTDLQLQTLVGGILSAALKVREDSQAHLVRRSDQA